MKANNLIKTFALALILPVLLGSCRKDHVCTCTHTNALGQTTTEKHILENQNSVDAVDACENFEKNNNWVTSNCNL